MFSLCFFFFFRFYGVYLVFCFFFFFFKQKTAYEIMPSLVGSEMCIRDRDEDLRSMPSGPRSPEPRNSVPGFSTRNGTCRYPRRPNQRGPDDSAIPTLGLRQSTPAPTRSSS